MTKKINYLDDDVETVAQHFVKSSRQVISLALKTYSCNDVVHKKLLCADIQAKIYKLQEQLATMQ